MTKNTYNSFKLGKSNRAISKAPLAFSPNAICIHSATSVHISGLDISNGSQHDIKFARKTIKKFKHCEYIMMDLRYYGLEQDGFKLIM